MTILWFLDIEQRYGLQHGGTLRYVNFSRNLISFGHHVWFVLANGSATRREERNRYLESLKQDGCFTGYFEIEVPDPPAEGGLSRLLSVFGIRNRHLRTVRESATRQATAIVTASGADLCIVSHRPLLFLVPELARHLATIVDWCDSFVLYYVREIRLLLTRRQFRRISGEIKNLLRALGDELFYSRQADLNLVVSCGDKNSFGRMNLRPERNAVLGNGVAAGLEVTRNRSVERRLIFTGTMSFPPNYQGAIWFIDNVMPLVVRRDPSVQLVIAGQEPVPELAARSGGNVTVTGAVPSVRAEIERSLLYVAPLISGTGFRNKVAEAIACGVHVIGTPMALEFLDQGLRQKLSVAATADEFAERIFDYLGDPASYEAKIAGAAGILRTDYSWMNRSRQLESLCLALILARAKSEVFSAS